jgi:elongation factor P
MLGDTALYLIEGMEVKLTFYNGAPLDVEFPSSVELKVIEAETAIRGDTATGVTKKVKTETGLEVFCPQFVKVGDTIRVNTETGEYVTRV